MKVAMKNPNSGQMKEIKVGWSWTIFFFSLFFGIPLFMRGLIGWGCVMSAFFCLMGYIADLTENSPDMNTLLGFIFIVDICLIIYLSVTGNEKSAKKRLKKGWVFLDPESDAVKYAKGKWGIL